MVSWTPESIKYETFLRENKERLTALSEVASISVLADKYTPNDKDVDSLFFSMSGREFGSVWTFAGFMFNRVRGKYARLGFTKKIDRNSFLVYSVSSLYHRVLQLKMADADGLKTLHIRDVRDIPVPRFNSEIGCQLSGIADAVSQIQEVTLSDPDEILNNVIENELRLDPAQSPSAKNIKWSFERHAHHVTGISWDHAQDLEPLTFLTKSWLDSSKLPVVAFRDIVSTNVASQDSNVICIPCSVAKLRHILIESQDPIKLQRGWRKFCLKPDANLNYIRYYLGSRFVKDYLLAMSNYGHSFVDNLMDVPIVLPEHSRQILISQSVEDAMNQCEQERNSLNRKKSELQCNADALLVRKDGVGICRL